MHHQAHSRFYPPLYCTLFEGSTRPLDCVMCTYANVPPFWVLPPPLINHVLSLSFRAPK